MSLSLPSDGFESSLKMSKLLGKVAMAMGIKINLFVKWVLTNIKWRGVESEGR